MANFNGYTILELCTSAKQVLEGQPAPKYEPQFSHTDLQGQPAPNYQLTYSMGDTQHMIALCQQFGPEVAREAVLDLRGSLDWLYEHGCTIEEIRELADVVNRKYQCEIW